MTPERKITKIPAKVTFPFYKRVAAYCRVSTHHVAQEDSLKSQTERFQKMIDSRIDWKFVNIYSDVASGRNATGRIGFTNMMSDCKARKVDLILTKSVSRFGRNIVDTLDNIRELKRYGVDVYFEIENMYASDETSELMLTIVSAIAQEDSVSKGDNIRMGIEYKMRNGTSSLYSRPCYGYKKGADGSLVVNEKQANNVRWIFDLYLQGHSVVSIIRELKKRRIMSPGGNAVWSKRAVETMLANEKYVGNVIVGKTHRHEFPSNKRHTNKGEHKMYELVDSHTPIISKEVFDKVRQMRKTRSNVEIEAGKVVRRNTRYSMKNIAIKKVV